MELREKLYVIAAEMAAILDLLSRDSPRRSHLAWMNCLTPKICQYPYSKSIYGFISGYIWLNKDFIWPYQARYNLIKLMPDIQIKFDMAISSQI